MIRQHNLLSHHTFRTVISTPVTDLMRAIRTSLPINRSSSSRCRRLSSIARLCFSSFRCLPYSMMLAHVMKHNEQLWTLPLVYKVESLFTWRNCVSFFIHRRQTILKANFHLVHLIKLSTVTIMFTMKQQYSYFFCFSILIWCIKDQWWSLSS